MQSGAAAGSLEHLRAVAEEGAVGVAETRFEALFELHFGRVVPAGGGDRDAGKTARPIVGGMDVGEQEPTVGPDEGGERGDGFRGVGEGEGAEDEVGGVVRETRGAEVGLGDGGCGCLEHLGAPIEADGAGALIA